MGASFTGLPVRRKRGLRAHIRDAIVAKVRFWVDGHQFLYSDGPHQRLNLSYPTYATTKIIESVPNDGDPVTVGKYTGIHYTTVIIPGGLHHAEWVGTCHAYIENGLWVPVPGAIHSKGPVILGNDVFVAYGSVITSGVTIGDGAIVAAASVVVKNVEPYSIVGGNPAKHLRYRFDEPTREALLRIKWWDWEVDEVTRHKDQISSADVAGFVARHDPALGPPSCPLCSSGS